MTGHIRSPRRTPSASRTSASGSDTTRDLVPTTCTRSTERCREPTPLRPSTRTWLPATALDSGRSTYDPLISTTTLCEPKRTNKTYRSSASSKSRSPRMSSDPTSSNSSARTFLSLSLTVSPRSATRRCSVPPDLPLSHKGFSSCRWGFGNRFAGVHYGIAENVISMCAR